jgi:hypothetical protein
MALKKGPGSLAKGNFQETQALKHRNVKLDLPGHL